MYCEDIQEHFLAGYLAVLLFIGILGSGYSFFFYFKMTKLENLLITKTNKINRNLQKFFEHTDIVIEVEESKPDELMESRCRNLINLLCPKRISEAASEDDEALLLAEA
jgi:hypothetical protein